MTAGRRLVAAASVGAIAAALACGPDWTPTNPYDPNVPLTIRVVGPDTALEYGDTLTFTVETNPAWSSTWPAEQVSWDYVSGPAGLRSLGDGRFVVPRISDDAGVFTIRAQVGTRGDTATFVVRRRVASIAAAWCATNPPTRIAKATIYDTISGCITYDDRIGAPIPLWEATQTATISTDSSRLTIAPPAGTSDSFSVSPRAEGISWVHFALRRFDGQLLEDSLSVSVQQRAASGKVSPCAWYGDTIYVGDTLRYQVGWADAGGVAMRTAPASEKWDLLEYWTPDYSPDSVVSITPQGVVRALHAGGYQLIVTSTWNDQWQSSLNAVCYGVVADTTRP